ncbi:MAG: DUF308 domain-containing protein [Mogibacterium sp.]|nr:DUF308 domain-containing protein [Mogibacterium sp.]
MIKEIRLSAIGSFVLMLAAGILLLCKPKLSLQILCYAVAIAFALLAVTRLIAYIRLKKENSGQALLNAVLAIFLFAVALYVLVKWETVAGILPTILGVLVIIDGAALIFTGIGYNRYLPKKGLSSYILGILCIGLGYFTIAHSFSTQIFFMRFIGATLVLSAIFNAVNQILIERADVRKRDYATVRFDTFENTPEPEVPEEVNEVE